MSPAERKFCQIEPTLMRAQSLLRVLRNVCETGPDGVDPVLWGGIYVIVGEAETSIDEAADIWKAAHKMSVGE